MTTDICCIFSVNSYTKIATIIFFQCIGIAQRIYVCVCVCVCVCACVCVRVHVRVRV